MTMKEAMWTQKEERKEGEEEPGQPVAKRQLQQGGVMSCDQPPASAQEQKSLNSCTKIFITRESVHVRHVLLVLIFKTTDKTVG